MKAKIREAGLGTADLLERQQVVARHEQALARLAEAARAKKAPPAKAAPGGRHSTDYSRFDHVASDDDDTDEDMPGLADPDAAAPAAAAEESDESASSASETDDEMPGLEDQEPPAAAPAAAAAGECLGTAACPCCAARQRDEATRAARKARSEALKREKAVKAGARQRELIRKADEKRQRDRAAMARRKAAEREHEAERERRSREAREQRARAAEAERAQKLAEAEQKRDAEAARAAADRAFDALRAVGTCRSCSSTIIHGANRVAVKCSGGCAMSYLAKCWETAVAPAIARGDGAYACPTDGCGGHLVRVERTTCKHGAVEAVREEACRAPSAQKPPEATAKKAPAPKRAAPAPRPAPAARLPADATASVWVGPLTDADFERRVDKALRRTALSAKAIEGIRRSLPPLGFLEAGPPEFVPGLAPRPYARVRASTATAAQIVARALEGRVGAGVVARVLSARELDAVVALETASSARSTRAGARRGGGGARGRGGGAGRRRGGPAPRGPGQAGPQQRLRAAVAAAPFPAPAARPRAASGLDADAAAWPAPDASPRRRAAMELAAADALEGAALDTTEDLYCPITHELFEDPCVLEGDGRTYERRAIEEWLRRGNRTSPLTSRTLASTRLAPNRDVRAAAAAFRAARGRADSDELGALRPEAAAPPAPPARAPADGTARLVQALAAVGCALDATAEQLLRDAEVDLDCVHDLEPEDVAEVGLTSHDAAALLAARPRLRGGAAPPRRGGLPGVHAREQRHGSDVPARGGPRPGGPAPAEAGWACAACTPRTRRSCWPAWRAGRRGRRRPSCVLRSRPSRQPGAYW